jgi:hypothetical protein
MVTRDAVSSLRAGLERLLIVWLTLLCWIAYRWPAWYADWLPDAEPFDPFVLGAGWLKPVFALTMLAIGSLLPADEVRQVLRHSTRSCACSRVPCWPDSGRNGAGRRVTQHESTLRGPDSPP